MASSFLRFLDHTQRRSTVGRIPLDEWSARRRNLYLTTHNTHNRQISMTPVGFEPTISAGEQPQTYALDRAATGTWGSYTLYTILHKMTHVYELQCLVSSNSVICLWPDDGLVIEAETWCHLVTLNKINIHNTSCVLTGVNLYCLLVHKTWKFSSTLPLRSLTLYIYGAPILDVSRSHTTTQHSR